MNIIMNMCVYNFCICCFSCILCVFCLFCALFFFHHPILMEELMQEEVNAKPFQSFVSV